MQLSTVVEHHESPGAVAYLEVLDRALADLHLTPDELAELAEFATEVGMSAADITLAHRRHLDGLLVAAVEDGVVTTDEYHQLCRAAAALRIDQGVVERATAAYRTVTTTVTLGGALTVCFTGEPVDAEGRAIERWTLERHAEKVGLTPVDSVTKATDLLVAADPSSQSGKAGKARRYGIPVIDASVFLKAAPGESVSASDVAVREVVTLVCAECNATWIGSRRSNPATMRCADCSPPPGGQVPARKPAPAQADIIEELTCSACGQTWERQRVRGRKPLRCPTCN